MRAVGLKSPAGFTAPGVVHGVSSRPGAGCSCFAEWSLSVTARPVAIPAKSKVIITMIVILRTSFDFDFEPNSSLDFAEVLPVLGNI